VELRLKAPATPMIVRAPVTCAFRSAEARASAPSSVAPTASVPRARTKDWVSVGARSSKSPSEQEQEARAMASRGSSPELEYLDVAYSVVPRGEFREAHGPSHRFGLSVSSSCERQVAQQKEEQAELVRGSVFGALSESEWKEVASSKARERLEQVPFFAHVSSTAAVPAAAEAQRPSQHDRIRAFLREVVVGLAQTHGTAERDDAYLSGYKA
jgi:hypothetical protein